MGQGTVTELVGRERESAQLGQAVEEVAGGDVRVVALIGEAGIGKSALPFGLVADALDASLVAAVTA